MPIFRALAALATASARPTVAGTVIKAGKPMATPEQLGEYIFKANPYTRQQTPSTMNPCLEETEKYNESVAWEFKTASYRVQVALRIPYYFTDANGQTVKDYLLIGFEGSGGA